MANPTAVNIGIGFDTKELTKGVELARGQVQSFMRDVKATITDTERFAQKVNIGKSLLARGDINQAEFNRVIAMYRQKYGIIDEGEKRLAEYNAHKQAIARREEESMIFMHNLRKTGMQMEQEAHAKKLADIAAEKKAEDDSMVFWQLLSKTQKAMEQEAHAKRLADIEAEKKAEEAEMIFRHELLKQVRLDEEQRHSQKMANIAAEKKFSETLGVGAYGTARSAIPPTDLSKPLIDPVTGAVIKQKQTVDALGISSSQLASSTSKIKAEYVSINHATGETLQHSQSILSVEYKRNQALQVYNKLVREAQNENKKLAASQKESANKTGGGSGFLGRNLGQFGTGVLAGFGFAGVTSAASQAGQALGDFVADSIKIAMERQRIGAAMEALLGSEQAAKKLTTAMRDLDRQSMLTYGTISKGAQTLLGFGVAQEMVMPSLDALSKISMGNAERFQSLSLAFGQVAASGKLAGQEILQMVNAGFNPLQEIARVTGKQVSQLKADVEAGRVSFLQVAEAIMTATEAGGRFEKISQKMLETPAGMLAKLHSDFEIIKADLGERLMPSMVTLFETIRDNEFVVETLSENLTWIFSSFALGLALLKDHEKLFNDPRNFHKLEESAKVISNQQKRQEQIEKNKQERLQRERDKAQKEADFNKMPKEERKKRLADEQAKMDEFRADQQRAKTRADMQKKIQELEDGTDRNRYFRDIGGHLAKTKDQIKLIGEAMDEYDKGVTLQEKAQRAASIHEEINRLQDDSNRLKMKEVDYLLRKYNLDKQTLTIEEQRQKSALLKAFYQNEKDREFDSLKKFAESFDKIKEAASEIAKMMQAVEAGLLDQKTLDEQSKKLAESLVTDKLSTESPRMMDLGQTKLAAQKLNNQLANEKRMIKVQEDLLDTARKQLERLKNPVLLDMK